MYSQKHGQLYVTPTKQSLYHCFEQNRFNDIVADNSSTPKHLHTNMGLNGYCKAEDKENLTVLHDCISSAKTMVCHKGNSDANLYEMALDGSCGIKCLTPQHVKPCDKQHYSLNPDRFNSMEELASLDDAHGSKDECVQIHDNQSVHCCKFVQFEKNKSLNHYQKSLIKDNKLTDNNSSTHFSTSNDLHSANNIQNEAHIAHKQFQDLRQKQQQLLFSSVPMTESAKLAYGLQFIFGNSDLPKATSALGLSLEASAPNYSPVPTNIDENQSSGIQNLVSEYLKEEQNIETPTVFQAGSFQNANRKRHIYDVQESSHLNQLTPVHRNKPRLLSLHKKRNKFPKKLYFQTLTDPVTISQHENIFFEKTHSVQDKVHFGGEILNSDPYSARCKQYPYSSARDLAPYSTGSHQIRHHHVPHYTNRLYRCENLAQLQRYGNHRRNRLNRLKRTKNVLKNIIAGTRTASMSHKRYGDIGSGNIKEAELNQNEYYRLGGFPNYIPEHYSHTKLDNYGDECDSNLSKFLYVTDEDRKQEVLKIYNNYLQHPGDCKIIFKSSSKHGKQPIISLSQQSYEDLIQMSTINSTKPSISIESIASKGLKRCDITEQSQFPNKHILKVQECQISCDEIAKAPGHESLAESHFSEENWSNFSEGSYCDDSTNLFKTLGTMQNSQDSDSVKIEQVNSCCKIDKHSALKTNSYDYRKDEELKEQSVGNVLPPTKMTLTLKPIQVIKDFDNDYTDFKWPRIDWEITRNPSNEITEEQFYREKRGQIKEKESTSKLDSRNEAAKLKKTSELNSPTTDEKKDMTISLNDLSITCRNEGFSNEVSISTNLEEEKANKNTRFPKNEIRIDHCNIESIESEKRKEANEDNPNKRISNTEKTEKLRVQPNDKTDIINLNNQMSIAETRNKSKVSLNEDIGYSLTDWFKMNEFEENYDRDRDPDKEKMGGIYQVRTTGQSSELVKRNPMYENWKNKANRNKIFFTHDKVSTQKPMLSKRQDINSIIENRVTQAICLISATKPIDGTVVRPDNCKDEAAQQIKAKYSSDTENTLLDLVEAGSLVKNSKVLKNDKTLENNINISNGGICSKGLKDAVLYPLELSFNTRGSKNINSNYVYGVYDVRPELQEMNEALHLNNSISILSKEVNGSLRPTEKVKDFSKTTNMYSAHDSDIDLYSKAGSALCTHSPFLLSEFSPSSSPLWMTSDLDSTGAGSGYNQVTTAATEVATLEGLDELFEYKNTSCTFGSYKDENNDYNTAKGSRLSTFKSFDQSDTIQPAFLSSFIDFDSTCLPNSKTLNRSLANKSFNLSKPIPRRSFRSKKNQQMLNEAAKGSILNGPVNLIDYPKCLFDNNLEQNKDLISGFKELSAATISMVAGTTTAAVVAAAALSGSANKQKDLIGFDGKAQNSNQEIKIHDDTTSKPSVEPTPLTRMVDIGVQIKKEKESLDDLRNQDNDDKKFSESILMVRALPNNFETAEACGEHLLPKRESFRDSEPILELYHKFSSFPINDANNDSLSSTNEGEDTGGEKELSMPVENNLNMKSRNQTPVVDLEIPTEKWSNSFGSKGGDIFSTDLEKSQVVDVVLNWQEKNAETNAVSKLPGGEAVRRTQSLNTGVQAKAGIFQSIAEKTEVGEINRSKTEANKHKTWKWKQDLAVNNRLNHSEITFVLGLTDSSLPSLLAKENMTTKYTDTFSKASMALDLTFSDHNEANESQL